MPPFAAQALGSPSIVGTANGKCSLKRLLPVTLTRVSTAVLVRDVRPAQSVNSPSNPCQPVACFISVALPGIKNALHPCSSAYHPFPL